MTEKTYATPCGTIHYWIGKGADTLGVSLVFLPGLTADHRLFDRQIAYFEEKCPIFVWDAPGHAASWPFDLTFSLEDKARWLHEILIRENMRNVVIVGQSMGGYVGQMYAQLFPEKLRGFISIDSASLQREYITAAELWLLKRMEPVYRYYPWKWLLKQGTNGVATSNYGRTLMRSMMMVYDGDQRRYAGLAGHGFRILAEAIEKNLPYEIKCPALLICGEKDHAGSCIRYNKAWHKKTGFPIAWIKDAGHNSNTDAPERINALIEELAGKVVSGKRIEVVAAIITEQNKIFATQRGYGEFKDGWEFPGGKMEAGETPEQALRREIREELDTEINVGELFETVEYDYPAFHLTMHCFLCTVRSGDLVLKEHEAARWLTREALDSVDWLPADRGLIEKLRTQSW